MVITRVPIITKDLHIITEDHHITTKDPIILPDRRTMAEVDTDCTLVDHTGITVDRHIIVDPRSWTTIQTVTTAEVQMCLTIRDRDNSSSTRKSRIISRNRITNNSTITRTCTPRTKTISNPLAKICPLDTITTTTMPIITQLTTSKRNSKHLDRTVEARMSPSRQTGNDVVLTIMKRRSSPLPM